MCVHEETKYRLPVIFGTNISGRPIWGMAARDACFLSTINQSSLKAYDILFRDFSDYLQRYFCNTDYFFIKFEKPFLLNNLKTQL